MKVLVFGHKDCIDGMGGVILAKLAFDYVNYELCDPEELPKLLQDYLDDNSIYTFDKIFIVDLWLTDPLLEEISKDSNLNNKLFIFDHHRSAIEDNLDRYPFTKIRVADEFGKCSGTPLFYEYLLNNDYLEKSAKGIYKFVELTRKFDTLEWKTRYDDKEPEDLSIFFNSVGEKYYIEHIYKKLFDNDFHFSLTEEDNKVVEIKRLESRYKLESFLKTIRYKKVAGYKAIIIDIEYDYRNETADFLKSTDYEGDFIMMVARDNNTVSFRSINSDVNVRMIAENYDGKGHDFAAFAKINNDLEKVISKEDE